MIRNTLSVLLSIAAFGTLLAESPGHLELHKGDHVAIIGNTLADRQQHAGWLEALIQKTYPNLDLTFRNLGFSADELTVRPRSMDVPTTEEWLKRAQADVVLAYYGFDESFHGPDGLKQFREDLDAFIKNTLKQHYNDKSAPKLILFSPIANENLKDPNYPDGSANNKNIALYTAAMAEVAKANNVPFVDLFKATQELYAQSSHPLTHNGIHLTEEGYKQIAPVEYQGLFGKEAPKADDPKVEKIRQAVLERNRQWHHIYRSVDQYNIYGQRSTIAYPDAAHPEIKVTNHKIIMEEFAQRQVMVDNRDKAIWAVAKGGEYHVVDKDLPPVDKVAPNKLDVKPYISGEEALKYITVPRGCKVELVASEETFPELVKPVQMAWDTKGRLWVAAWPNYPETTPTTKDFDKLLVFDIDPKTGKPTKCTHFVEDLNCPTGFQFFKDGVLVMRSPELEFLRDTNGDGKADWKERVLDGMDAADSHHETNSMCLDPGGATYLSDGVFHRTNVETYNGPVRNQDGCIYRFEPLTNKFERYIPYGFANPHGRVFDYWGNDLITDATGNANYFGPAFSGHLDDGKHPSLKQFWDRPSRPCPGTNILTSRHFPDDWQGDFLNCNVISFQGIFRCKITEDGSGIHGETIEPLVTTDIALNPNFRPSAVSVAPDGSIYFCDWCNQLIGHLQHHLRDPNRDHLHGRIYRITYEGRPLLKPKKIAGEPIEKLLDLLKEPENDVRMRTKIELGARDPKRVIAAVDAWIKGLDKNAANYEHNILEGLWVHQWHNIVDRDLLVRVLNSPDYHARAAGVRVLCYWRDRVPGALDLLQTAVNDVQPRVRLEAVRALSFINGADVPRATDLTYAVLKKPTDYYLEYTFKETLKQLQSLSHEKTLPSDPAVLAALINQESDKDLNGLPKVEPVLYAMLERKSYDVPHRDSIVNDLVKLHKSSKAAEIAAALERLDAAHNSAAARELTKVLVVVPAADLAKARKSWVALAGKAADPQVRSAAWAAVIIGDGKASAAWAEAKEGASRDALIEAIAVVPDPTLRAQFQANLSAVIGNASGATLRAVLAALPLMGPTNAKANFGVLANYLVEGKERNAAASAITQLSRDDWDKDKAAAIAKSILAYAKTVDAKKRSDQDFVELNQLGMQMASLGGDADVRKKLRGLGVAVFVVKTVREQLRYDNQRIVVEKGKPFEIIFQNSDVMPHNLVVVGPEQHAVIGMASQTMGPDPEKGEKKKRQYIPKGAKFLDATHLLEPGSKETLQLTAPNKEGEYEYVCTFPGHWMIMWGKLIVTKDVDAYLAAHPTFTLPMPMVPLPTAAK